MPQVNQSHQAHGSIYTALLLTILGTGVLSSVDFVPVVARIRAIDNTMANMDATVGPMARDYAQAVPGPPCGGKSIHAITSSRSDTKPTVIAKRVQDAGPAAFHGSDQPTFLLVCRIALPISFACFLVCFGVWSIQTIGNTALRSPAVSVACPKPREENQAAVVGDVWA